MDTDEAIRRLEERLTKRLDDARKEDKDIRHARNAAQDRLTDTLQVRITALEQSCKLQESECEKVATQVHRLVAAMQGDPELGSDGHIKRTTDTLQKISDQISNLESDKAESRTHRQNHADLPGRVHALEEWKSALENRKTGAISAGKALWQVLVIAVGIVLAIVNAIIWIHDRFWGHQ